MGILSLCDNKYNFLFLNISLPEDDERNTVGQTGVKIITSGAKEYRNQITSIDNKSMYSNG